MAQLVTKASVGGIVLMPQVSINATKSSSIALGLTGLDLPCGTFLAATDGSAFIAAAYYVDGSIIVSNDGLNFSQVVLGTGYIYGVCKATSNFVAIGPGHVYLSRDGNHWYAGGTLPHSNDTGHCVAMGDIVVSWDTQPFAGMCPTTTCVSSNGGRTWSAGTFPADTSFTDAAASSSIIVAIQSAPSTTYYTSTNGTSWTSRSAPTDFTAIQYINGRFYASANNGSYSTVYYSTNGTSWTAVTMPKAGYWSPAGYANGLYFMFDGYEQKLYSSASGTGSFTLAYTLTYFYGSSPNLRGLTTKDGSSLCILGTGGDTRGNLYKAPSAVVVTVASVGGMVFSGSAAVTTHNSITTVTSTGGIVFGGTAVAVASATTVREATGGIVFGGTAGMFIKVAEHRFSSGGQVFSGQCFITKRTYNSIKLPFVLLPANGLTKVTTTKYLTKVEV